MSKIKLLFLLMGLLIPFISLNAATPRLIKGESFSAVYYQAENGKRYVFPNQRIYNSWYNDFSQVVKITDQELFDISLGGNVFYKPNSRLVKITTDPKVYYVDKYGALRHVASERAAQDLFGSDWIKKIDDLPDEFFTGYTVGDAIDSTFAVTVDSTWTINNNQQKNTTVPETPAPTPTPPSPPQVDAGQQPTSINLTILMNSQDATLEWVVTGSNTDYGFAIVKSENENPTYTATTSQDDYKITTNSSAIQYTWNDLPANKAYYFRVCRLNSDSTCGTYSDQESVTTGVTDKTPGLTLSGAVENGIAKLLWKKNWISPNNGFYLVRNTTGNPKYITDPGVWVEKQLENYNWSGLNGVYHFRVCQYITSTPADCKYYSNDLELNIQ